MPNGVDLYQVDKFRPAREMSSFNKYDIYIIALLLSLAFGGIGGALAISRLLAVMMLPALTVLYTTSRTYIKQFLIVFGVFYAYCLLTMLWTPDRVEAIKELVYYPIHFLLFLEIVVFSRYSKHQVNSIALGWLAAVSLTLVVAIWELVTDQHLSMSVQQSGMVMNTGEKIIQRRFASVTYGNYNTYVTFLCFAIPFITYHFFNFKRKIGLGTISIFAVLLSVVCILFNASRGGVLSILIMGIVYLWNNSKRRNSFLTATAFVILVCIIIYSNGDIILKAISQRTANGSFLAGDSRYVIWSNAWEAFKPTLGLGVGIGGMTKAMEGVTKGITVTHNMFMEILLQYGYVFLSLFVTYIFVLTKKTLRVKAKSIQTCLSMALCAMPVYLIINSGYLLNPFVYAGFASMTVFTDYEHTQLLRKTLRQLIQQKRNTL